MPGAAPLEPQDRPVERRACRRPVRLSGWALVEGHHDVGPQDCLDLHDPLGRQEVPRSVDVALEGDAVVFHPIDASERKHLKSARVGEDRSVPVHEPMQSSDFLHYLDAGTQVQVVGVRQNDP